MAKTAFTGLIKQARQCRLCEAHLPLPPRPVIQGSDKCKVLIIGQAPGLKAHNSQRPWNDPSGVRLRQWLNVSDTTFYDEAHFAILPMGFCYPGKGTTGDLPPRPECAPKWHAELISAMPIAITLLIGKYAQDYYLQDRKTLTDRVANWRTYLPEFVVLPHPSPRNNIWLRKNPWFEQQVLPDIRARLSDLIG